MNLTAHKTHHWGTSHDSERWICTACECSPIGDEAPKVCVATPDYTRQRLIQLIQIERTLTPIEEMEIRDLWRKQDDNN